MDPLVKNTMWVNASVRKGFEVGSEIMRLTFDVQAQHTNNLILHM